MASLFFIISLSTYATPEWWYLHNPNNGVDIGVQEVYESEEFRRTENNLVTVAVVDSGIDFSHPDLENVIALNEKEIENNGVDEDENGFVDDLYGWNFYHHHFAPFDENGHGTHITGTIQAITKNRSRILPVRYSGPDGVGGGWPMVQAINYAVHRDAKIINCSWDGVFFEQNVYNALKKAGEKGVLFIVAAGNSGNNNDATPNYPGNFGLDNVITVASQMMLKMKNILRRNRKIPPKELRKQ